MRCGVRRLYSTPSASGATTFIEERGDSAARLLSMRTAVRSAKGSSPTAPRSCSTNAWLPIQHLRQDEARSAALSLMMSHPWKYPASDEEQKYRDGKRHNDD